MFLIVIVFLLVLVLSFAVVMVMTRPTTAERVIEGRIAKLSSPDVMPAARDDAMELVKVQRLSDLPWLDVLLRSVRLTQRIQLLIAQAESSWSVGGMLGACILLAMAGFALGYYQLAHALYALAPAVVFFFAPFLFLRGRRSHRRRTFARDLPEAIDLMARALRAGHSVPAAIEILGEESPESVRGQFREVYRQQTFGLPTRDALLQLGERMPLAELNFVITAILLQKDTGGNLVEVLEQTATVIRERQRIEGEVRIYTAQGRMTGWILSSLPIAMFFLLSLVNRSYSRVLVEDPTGQKLVCAGVVLMAIGGLAIRKIVNVKI